MINSIEVHQVKTVCYVNHFMYVLIISVNSEGKRILNYLVYNNAALTIIYQFVVFGISVSDRHHNEKRQHADT